jgi:rod shape-determining protein MreB and related proteins
MVSIKLLKNLVTNSIAIDMGTASTIIAVKGRDIVLDEPSLVAVNEMTGEIVAFGKDAADMRGREGRDIVVVAPLSGGVVADFDRTKKMLAHFVKKAKSGGPQVVTQAVIGMPSEVTPVEQRALLNAAEEANISKVFMMEEGLAATFGAGISPYDKKASAVVDIGASTTNIAVVARGNVIHSKSERIGSADINIALATHVRRHRGLQIGEETTEKLKTEFATTYLPEDLGKSTVVRGRDVITGAPAAIEITVGEIYPVIEEIVRRIALLISDILTELPPEVAADIHDRGILLTGGGALLHGLDLYLRDRVNLPVVVADEPRYATVRGLLQMFDEPMLLEKVARREPYFLQGTETPFET